MEIIAAPLSCPLRAPNREEGGGGGEGGRRGGGGGAEGKCILGTGLTHCSSLNSCIAHLVSVASFYFLLTIFGLTFPFIILSLPSENGLDSLICERQNPLAPSSMRLEPLVVSTKVSRSLLWQVTFAEP